MRSKAVSEIHSLLGNGYLGGPMANVPFSLLPPALYARHDTISYGIFLWSAGVNSPSYVLFWLLVHAHPTH